MPIEPIRRRIDGIVIGGSAGAMEALSVLLPALPAQLAAALFVVLHLPRDRPSLLVEVFKSKCALPVREAEDKEPVQPGTVYFAPADYHLLLEKGPQLALSADETVNLSRPSIDVLFESAADVYGKRLMGIILSGASGDGAAGLAAIRRAGGIALVQRPDSARVSLMIEAALERCSADQVLSLEEMAALLAELSRCSGG